MDMPTFLSILDSQRPATRQGRNPRQTPATRSSSNAFRIRQYGETAEWDCTVTEIAAALALSPDTVRAHCTANGWIGKMRSRPADCGKAPSPATTDEPQDIMSLMVEAA